MASASAGTRSALSWMPRSAPMLIAFRICSCTASGPSETMTTSPWFDFSLSRSAASTAQRSKSFTSYLSPASSYDAPSFPTEKRTSMTGTRLMQTAIFTARSPCEKVHIEGSRDSPRCAGAVDVASGRYRAHYVVEPHARAAVRAAIEDRPFYPRRRPPVDEDSPHVHQRRAEAVRPSPPADLRRRRRPRGCERRGRGERAAAAPADAAGNVECGDAGRSAGDDPDSKHQRLIAARHLPASVAAAGATLTSRSLPHDDQSRHPARPTAAV